MFFVRLVPLPDHVEGVVLPNEDGTYDIYINARLPVELRLAVLMHEVEHIKKDHFYDERPVWANEAEAG